MEMAKIGSKAVGVQTREWIYIYENGSGVGLKRSRAGTPMAERSFHDRVEDIKQKGKKLGMENAGGINCERHVQDDPPRKLTVWISQSSQFPVKMEMETQTALGATTVTTVFRNVEVNAKVPDALFELPASVRFGDDPVAYQWLKEEESSKKK